MNLRTKIYLATLSLFLSGMTVLAAVMPPYTIFWQSPAELSPQTLLLWSFDDTAQQSALDILEDGDINLFAGNAPDKALEDLSHFKHDTTVLTLRGTTSMDENGRFGRAIRLADGATAGTDSIGLGGCTLDFWISPDTQNECALLSAPRSEGLQLALDASGTPTLRNGQETLLTHNRRVPAGRWTHVAIILTPKSSVLLINGTPVTGPATKPPAKGFTLGGKGFSGRVDDIRLREGTHLFYEHDANEPQATANNLIDAPPYFIRPLAPSLSFSFDDTLKPEVQQRGSQTGTPAPSMFVPGVKGHGLLLNNIKEAGFTLQGDGILPNEEGSLSLWVQPWDWHNFYVELYGGSKSVNLFSERITFGGQTLANKTLTIRQGRDGSILERMHTPIHPGIWTHLLITWQKGQRTRVYINGRPQQYPQVQWSAPPPSVMKSFNAKSNGGGAHALSFLPSATAVDEFQIYDRALNSDEAWNSYARYLPDAKEQLCALEPIKCTLQYWAHSWNQKERLTASLICMPVGDKQAALLDATLLDKENRELATVTARPVDERGECDIEFPVVLAFGSYQVAVTIKSADGEKIAQRTVPYERVRPEWFQNTLGKERTIPAPWTPITVSENRLQVWGRNLTLGNNGLLETMVTLEKTVLAAPISLTVISDEKETVLTASGTPRFTETGDDRVTWTTHLTGGSISATLSAWMEYDGLLYTTITLDGTGASLEQLHVDIPLDGEIAKQIIANGSAMDFRASFNVQMLPDGQGQIWDSKTKMPGARNGLKPGTFLSQIWIGNDDMGLHFSAENDQGWTVSDEIPAQELIRTGDKVVFRLNVICEPTTLTQERRFHFILLPTPTKPIPEGWRAWNRAPRGTPLCSYDVIDDFNGFPLKAEHGQEAQAINFVMAPHSWEDAAKQRQELINKFGKENPVFLYIDYSWPKPDSSFDDWNHDLWGGTGRLPWTLPEVEDYMVWIVNEYIKRGLVEGIYIDDVSCGRTLSLNGSAYPFDNKDGRRAGFSSMGFRRFCQRVWKLFLAQGKEPHIVPHMTFCFEMPALSFCKAMVNGEAWDVLPHNKRDTIDVWGRDLMRIMGNSPKWGMPVFWKPSVQVGQGVPPRPDWLYHQTRAQHALTLQQDIWYLWCYPTALSILPAFDRFGMGDEPVGFIPSRNMGEKIVLTPSDASLMVCAWTKERSALVMVSNLGTEDRTVTVTPDAGTLFGTPAGQLVIQDVDPQLLPPVTDMLAIGETAPSGASGLLELEAEDDFNVMALLEGEDSVDPRKIEEKRLKMTLKGSTATFVVRRHDFRILLIEKKDR